MRLSLVILAAFAVFAAVEAGRSGSKGKGKIKRGGRKGVPPGQLKKMEKFMDKYGYVGDKGDKARQFVEAVKKSQRYAGCNVDGNFNDKCIQTKADSKRCGDMDMDKGQLRGNKGKGNAFGPTGSKGNRKGRGKRYVLWHTKWPKTSLTYQIDNFSPDLGQAKQRSIIEQCFEAWSDHSGLSFNEVPGSADIRLSYETFSHGDGSPFDGNNGVLAHAFYPTTGKLHFDDSETWAPPEACKDGVHINLYSVCVHEVGHALGLRHSDVQSAIMYAYYSGCTVNTGLASDDIAGIEALYGAGGGGGCSGFSCSSDSLCLPSSWECDGMTDCADGSDEQNCGGSGGSCPSGFQRCDNGGCVPKIWLCDDWDDCGDGSDERNCYDCGFLYRSCGNGWCIPYWWTCDGEDDCGNGWDEGGCSWVFGKKK